MQVTRVLVESYFDIVRKNLQDAVPKACPCTARPIDDPRRTSLSSPSLLESLGILSESGDHLLWFLAP